MVLPHVILIVVSAKLVVSQDDTMFAIASGLNNIQLATHHTSVSILTRILSEGLTNFFNDTLKFVNHTPFQIHFISILALAVVFHIVATKVAVENIVCVPSTTIKG
jgi:hypothetical protein